MIVYVVIGRFNYNIVILILRESSILILEKGLRHPTCAEHVISLVSRDQFNT